MKEITIKFIETVFTKGAEYIDDVDLTGLYEPVAREKEFGN